MLILNFKFFSNLIACAYQKRETRVREAEQRQHREIEETE